MYRFGCIELKINLCSIQAPAAELSGRAGDHFRSSSYGVSANRERSRHSEAAAEIPLLFGEKSSQTFCCFDSSTLKQALKPDEQRGM
jgi:hypothetical protein